jgi:hypothetical protein
VKVRGDCCFVDIGGIVNHGMGLEDSKILQAVKCWVIHSVDDRQTMGYMVSNLSWVIHSVDDRQTMG